MIDRLPWRRLDLSQKAIIAIFIWCLSVFPVLILPVKTVLAADAVIVVSAEDQFDYATACFEQKDYATAADEFKRFLFFFPDDGRIDQAEFYIGLSSFYAGDHQKALSCFHEIHEKLGFEGIGMSAVLQVARIRAAMGDYMGAADFLHNRTQNAPGSVETGVLNYHLGWLYVETGHFAQAGMHFDAIDPDDAAFPQASEISVHLKEYTRISSKSPAVAGLLSIVPGGGYLYCGRYQDAFISLVLNGLMAWAAVESFEDDRHGLGGLITVVGAGFYAGNIYGATTAAHKYNRQQQTAFARDLKNRFSVHLFSSMPGPGAGWTVQYQF